MPAIHPTTPPACPRKAGLAPRGTQQRPGSPGPRRTASLKQAALAPPPLQGLPRYSAAIRLLTVHRRRLMDSPSGYPGGSSAGGARMNTSGGWDTARPPWVPRARCPTMLTLNTPDRPPAVSHPTPHRQTMSRLVIGRGFGAPTAPRPDRRPPRVRVSFGLVVCVGALQTPPRGGRPALC